MNDFFLKRNVLRKKNTHKRAKKKIKIMKLIKEGEHKEKEHKKRAFLFKLYVLSTHTRKSCCLLIHYRGSRQNNSAG